MISFEKLIGLDSSHLLLHDNHWVHPSALKPLIQLQQEAKQAGIKIAIVSSFRSFQDQQRIWNAKATGNRILLDREENTVSFEQLSSERLFETILFWTALPGLSRHHWGTEFDIYDLNALPNPDYQVQLTQREATTHFSKLHHWLSKKIDDHNTNFFRPYQNFSGGVSPEPWHISFSPVASEYLNEFKREETIIKFKNFMSDQDIELKSLILNKLEWVLEKYLFNINY